METRKVQLSGGTTYTVSLPKKWAQEHGIGSGSVLALHPSGDGSLLVEATTDRSCIDQGVTVDISTTGTKLIVKSEGDSLISLNISGDSTVSYSLDVGPTESVKFRNEERYSGTDIRDSFQLVDKYLAIRTTTSGSTNDKSVITIQEAR